MPSVLGRPVVGAACPVVRNIRDVVGWGSHYLNTLGDASVQRAETFPTDLAVSNAVSDIGALTTSCYTLLNGFSDEVPSKLSMRYLCALRAKRL